MEAKEKKEKRELSRDPKQILKREKYWREKFDSERQHAKVRMRISIALMEDAKDIVERMMESFKSNQKRNDTIIRMLLVTNFVTVILYIFK